VVIDERLGFDQVAWTSFMDTGLRGPTQTRAGRVDPRVRECQTRGQG